MRLTVAGHPCLGLCLNLDPLTSITVAFNGRVNKSTQESR